MIDDGTALLTIGELARATGLTVRTIRYWSDEDSHTSVTDATLEAFGIDPTDLDLDTLRSLEGAPRPQAQSEPTREQREPSSRPQHLVGLARSACRIDPMP